LLVTVARPDTKFTVIVFIFLLCRHPRPKSRPAFILITKYLNKPDEDLLQISDDDVKQYGDAALSLGITLTASSSSIPHTVNSWQQEFLPVYK